MTTQLRNLALAAGIALALTMLSPPAGAGDSAQEVTDARQESQIWTTYMLSPHLRANDIQVSVHNGNVVLTGKVEEDVNKDLAKQIALGVDGIKEVDNQIVVQADYVAPPTTTRRYGEIVEDATITAAVKSKLAWSKHTDGLSTEVSTLDGKVTLRGSSESAASKDLASRLAMNTRGVIAVNNHLVIAIAPPGQTKPPISTTEQAGRNIADSWITTKVKSTFMYSANVNSSDISVSTANGVVTLSGKVSSGAERALAIEFAQNVRGVKSVDSKALVI